MAMRRGIRSTIGGLILALALAPMTMASTTVVIRPTAQDGWAAQSLGPACGAVLATGSQGFEIGPSIPPAGQGSLFLAIGSDGNNYELYRNSNYTGVKLADLTTLSYFTYVTVFSAQQAPFLVLDVDLDGDTIRDDALFFEPVYQRNPLYSTSIPDQGAVVTGTWQDWDALSGGWWSAFGLGGAGPGTDVKTLSEYLTNTGAPNATITLAPGGFGGLRIAGGCGAPDWDNFDGNVDALTVGVLGVATSYDFEPNLPQPPNTNACKKGGWMSYARADGSTFKNQGDCIQYVNTGK